MDRPGVALGMRRLSIIDLSSGHQPIHNEDGIDLDRLQRRDLQLPRAARRARGARPSLLHQHRHRRRSFTPTSSGARRRSDGCAACSPSRSGTRATDRCSLARDRVGIKPLHYAEVGGRLYFGSEIKSLLCAPDVPREIDLDALEPLPLVPVHAARRLDLPRRPQAAAGSPAALARRDASASSGTGSIAATENVRRVRRTMRSRSCAQVLRRRGAVAPGERRAARRVPLRRHRLEPRRRADGARRRAAA